MSRVFVTRKAVACGNVGTDIAAQKSSLRQRRSLVRDLQCLRKYAWLLSVHVCSVYPRERHDYHELLLSHFPAVRTCSFTIRSILCPCTCVTLFELPGGTRSLHSMHHPAEVSSIPPSHRGEPGSTSSVLLSLNDQHLQHLIPMPQSPTGVYTAYRHTRLHGSSSFRSEPRVHCTLH